MYAQDKLLRKRWHNTDKNSGPEAIKKKKMNRSLKLAAARNENELQRLENQILFDENSGPDLSRPDILGSQLLWEPGY